MEYDDLTKSMHDDLINETHDPVVINGMEFEPARILETLDPIAYRESYLGYCDSLDDEE